MDSVFAKCDGLHFLYNDPCHRIKVGIDLGEIVTIGQKIVFTVVTAFFVQPFQKNVQHITRFGVFFTKRRVGSKFYFSSYVNMLFKKHFLVYNMLWICGC
jgi:hypothetical protein